VNNLRLGVAVSLRVWKWLVIHLGSLSQVSWSVD